MLRRRRGPLCRDNNTVLLTGRAAYGVTWIKARPPGTRKIALLTRN